MINNYFYSMNKEDAYFYRNIELTDHKNLIKQILSNLMNQYYNHVKIFNELYKKKPKKYKKIEKDILNQLIFMEKIMTLMNKYFDQSKKITKEDVYLFILRYNISPYSLNEILYRTLIKYFKKQFSEETWEEDKLFLYEGSPLDYSEYMMLINCRETSIGKPDIDFDELVNIIERYIYEKNNKNLNIDVLTNLNLILDDFCDKECPYLDSYYQTNIHTLIKYLDLKQNPNQLIKKLNDIK